MYNLVMKYFKGYKIRTIIAILAKFVEAVFEILIPLFMARLIDVGIIQHNTEVIYKSVIWMIVLTILGYSFSLVCQINASIISQKIGAKIRSDLFKHELMLSNEVINSYSSATLSSRLSSDVIYIQDMIARVIRLGIRAPFLIVGTITALMYINKKLAYIMLISIPIFTVVISLFMYVSMKTHKQATKYLDKLLERVSELLSGTRIIRAFSKQDQIDNQFNASNLKLYISQKKVIFNAALSNPFTTLIMNFLLIILVYVSSIQINVGVMSQGEVLAVINYCSQLLLTLIVTMNLIMLISRGLTASNRVKEILNLDVENIDKGKISNIEEMNITFENVDFSFSDEKRKVLDNINIDIKHGSTIGIIGLSGSGKSTLLKQINQTLKHSSGKILINDKPIEDYSLKALRESIGYVVQSAQFIRGSLKENIEMGGQANATEALIDAQGQDILDKGLDFIIEENGRNLSGGQKQRVNIARALNKKVKLLLLDDSFSALDGLTSSNLLNILNTKYKNTTKIIASQRINSIKDADLILVMDKGKIVASGTHNTLLEENEIYKNINQLQKEGEINNEIND